MLRKALPGLSCVLVLVLASGSAPGGAPDVTSDLPRLGIPVTGGAAPGYVEDRTCAVCHSQIAGTYREKGMARAFFRPRPETDIEDFSAPAFFHAPSRQYLRIVREGDRLVFRRWQVDSEGRTLHLFERPVDWVLGSGNHARTYLYRVEGGEVFQLPLAWYSQTRRWGMAPGFDRPDHEGVLRLVRRECLFCHTAYPDVPAGSDASDAPHVFPAVLPEGLGCQRCHGPGAEHVGLSLGGIAPAEDIRRSVFNPGRLPAARQDEVCMTCHLQPTVALPGLRRFGRGDFSYRAGEPLAGHLVQVDVEQEGEAPGDRFEINHHAYRLRQSRCFLASGGAPGCVDCHDPHRAMPGPEMAARVRETCRSCHAGPRPAAGADHSREADCASCHMSKRRPRDVVQVVMTDHLIRRRPGGPELLAPLAERDPVLTGLRVLPGEGSPSGDLAELYRGVAAVRAAGGDDAIAYLERMLARVRPVEPEPYLDLVKGYLRKRRFAEAETTLAGLLERQPGHPAKALALEWLALARAGQGKTGEAVALLRRVVEKGSGRAEAEYNLGRLLAFRGEHREAEAHLVLALAANPNLFAGWFHLGEVRAAQGRPAEAADCYRRALEIQPRYTAAYLGLGRVLPALGRREEALRYLRHGAAGNADRPAELSAALDALAP